MKDIDQARELAIAMVEIGRAMGKGVHGLLTAMDQPLGRAVGNGVEVAESIACLRGEGPADLMEVTYSLGAEMLLLAEVETDLTTARERLEKTITDGSALAKFGEIVAVQGGDARVIDDPATILPSAKHQVPLVSDRSGLVQDVDAMEVALAALRLGAGRAKAEAEVDPAVGITDLVKVGETVEKGQPLAVVHANDDESLLVATTQLREGIAIGDSPVAIPPLIAERIA